jgi:hypothetical protein
MLIDNHIGVFPNAVAIELCDALIQTFDKAAEAGFAITRKQQEKVLSSKKDDLAVYVSDTLPMDNYRVVNPLKVAIWEAAYKPYADKYSVLNEVGAHSIYDVKLQRTEVGGGYHVWHCEQASRASSQRLMAFIVYLNDVDEGGETEFLYQSKRVKPTKGTVLLFPASYTHTHRGNPPLSGTKYIATGWVEY